MLSPSPPCRGKLLSSALLAGLVVTPPLHGQDFTRQIAGADRFFDNGVVPESLIGLFDPTFEGKLKGQFSYSMSVSAGYDSNINLGRGAGGSDQGSATLSINPSIVYTSDPEGEARNVLTAYYSPSYQYYFTDSDLGGLNHTGGVAFDSQGAKTTFKAFFNVAQNSGADRLTGGYSEGTIYSLGGKLSYQLAPRTSVYGSATASRSEYSGGGQQGGSSYVYQLGAFWAATERLSIGPSLRYSVDSASTTGDRTATGFLFNATYVASEKTNFSGSIGLESVEYSRQGGGGDVSFTGGLDFNYAINELWGWSGGISYANIPSPSAVGYVVNDLEFSTSLTRNLTFGTLTASAFYNITDSQQVGPALAAQRDGNYYGVDLQYGRRILRDTTGLFALLSYARNDGTRSWDRWMFSLGLNRTF